MTSGINRGVCRRWASFLAVVEARDGSDGGCAGQIGMVCAFALALERPRGHRRGSTTSLYRVDLATNRESPDGHP